jgi:restriction enzyme bgcI subunit beta
MRQKLKLNDREWREFQFKDVFHIVDGYYNKKPPMGDNGTLPFLGATQYNNGVTGMTSKDSVRLHDKVGGNSMNDVEKRFYAGGCIAITNNGSVGHAYYQASEFTCSHDITVVYLKDQVMSKELATFLIPSIQKAGESFAYAKKWRPIRMRCSRLMLPIQADGTPDWKFMSAFMKQIEQDTLSDALRYFKPKKSKQILTAGGGKSLAPFYMGDVVSIANGVRLTKSDMTEGARPFIGASEANNGLTEFVGNTNSSCDHDVLGVNYNGSVGYSFYHPYEALFSDDVKRVRWKDKDANNKYTLLYLSTAIAQQRSKYAYGYKFNAQRMKRQIIMLPACEDGSPDYARMEKIMRVMEYETLRKYLKQIEA